VACKYQLFKAADNDVLNRSFGANFFNRAVSRILKKLVPSERPTLGHAQNDGIAIYSIWQGIDVVNTRQ